MGQGSVRMRPVNSTISRCKNMVAIKRVSPRERGEDDWKKEETSDA